MIICSVSLPDDMNIVFFCGLSSAVAIDFILHGEERIRKKCQVKTVIQVRNIFARILPPLEAKILSMLC